jgi:hypothetical protein
MLFRADDRDGTAKAGGPQRFRSASSGLAGASNHYFLDWLHRRFKLPGRLHFPFGQRREARA